VVVTVGHDNFDIPIFGQREEPFLVGLNDKVDGAETFKGINDAVVPGTVLAENIHKSLPFGNVTSIALVEAIDDEVDGLICIEFGQVSRPLILCTILVVNSNVVVVVDVELCLLVKWEILMVSVDWMIFVRLEGKGCRATYLRPSQCTL
jgi:hypothetical protein